MHFVLDIYNANLYEIGIKNRIGIKNWYEFPGKWILSRKIEYLPRKYTDPTAIKDDLCAP